MGLFAEDCADFLFPLKADIYYPQESQDEYGAINKKWDFDQTVPCSFHSIQDKASTKNVGYDSDDQFYMLSSILYGRFKKDPRKSSSGLLYPVSNILIVNVRGGCTNDPYFVETDGDYVGEPTIFEIKTCQPFINPFGVVEYYKMVINRSDRQELYNRVYC